MKVDGNTSRQTVTHLGYDKATKTVRSQRDSDRTDPATLVEVPDPPDPQIEIIELLKSIRNELRANRNAGTGELVVGRAPPPTSRADLHIEP